MVKHEHIHCGTDKCCGDCQKEINMSSMSELQKMIEDLQKEVEELKARVKTLEEK